MYNQNNYIMELTDYLWIPILCTFASFFTSWGIGANDCANSFATSVGAKVLTLRQAVLVAAIFEFTGAFLMGSHVTDTVRKKIVDNSTFENAPEELMWGMLCSVFAAGIWLCIATKFKLPVSTTHSIVGAIVGFGLAAKGDSVVDWTTIVEIVISWVLSPVLSGIFAALIFLFIKYAALIRETPVENLYKIYPILIFCLFFINALFIIYKGTPALSLDDTPLWLSMVCSISIGIGCALIGQFIGIPFIKKRIEVWLVNRENQRNDPEQQEIELSFGEQFTNKSREIVYNNEFNRKDNFKKIDSDLQELIQIDHFEQIEKRHTTAAVYDETSEKLCSYLQVITACFASFAHGSNDVANSIAPLAACWAIYNDGIIDSKVTVPLWILAMGGVGIVIGLSTWGYKVIDRIGKELTKVTPSRGFPMEMGPAITVLLASRLEIPVSTTHCQIGSVFGVGLIDGVKNVDFNSLGKIILSWIVTLPVTGGISAGLYCLGHYAP